MRDTGWTKSTRSAAASDNCVEVRIADAGTSVRDSKNPAGGRLTFERPGFSALLTHVTEGR